MKKVIINSPAKINLFLKVTGKRPDGYHDIYTIFQKVSLFDKVEICANTKVQSNTIELECSDPEIAADNTNLAWIAAELFLDKSGAEGSVSIKLHKKIPAGAGLGGGSSNAAAVLKGLNALFGSPLGLDDLLGLGADLGADVPFFITEWGAATGTGKGTRLHPVQSSNSYYILIWPGFSVSTKWAYENFVLTSNKETTIFGPGQGSEEVFLWQNDLEEAVMTRYPLLRELKSRLKDAGALHTLMSGSGSVIFGEFPSRQEAMNGLSRLATDHSWKTYVVQGLQ